MRISGFYDLGGRKGPVVRIRLSRGNDRDILIRCLDEAGAVVNITGATPIEFHVSKNSNASRDITKSLTDGIVITDAANGEFTVSLAPSDTSELSDLYVWDAQLTLNSKLRTVARGALVIQAGVGDE